MAVEDLRAVAVAVVAEEVGKSSPHLFPYDTACSTRAWMRAFDVSPRDGHSANKAYTREKVFLGYFFAPAKK